ncbi:MAG: OmpA family protein, partial [Bacteroidota bacterium]|nr:OmpA family protein [Bacteroidota bacterium]
MKPLLLSISIFIACSASQSVAQVAEEKTQGMSSSTRPAIGGFGGVNMNMAHADFSQLPGVPDCNASYKSGFGFGPSFGAFYELPLAGKFSLLLRGAYTSYSQKLVSNEETPVIIGGVQSQGVIEHSITASLASLGIQPLASYHITDAFAIHIGGEIGYMMRSSFSQIETLTQPQGTGVFDNGLRTRNQQSGKIPNSSSIVASLLGGISYQFPLNHANTMQAVPELSYSYGLTSVAKGITWSVNSLRGAIAIRYELPENKPEIPKRAPDTIPPPVPAPIASITASGVGSDGLEVPTASLRVEEVYSTRMTPLLPYIFFAKDDQVIPSRYDRIINPIASGFSELDLKHEDALKINHETLNIIGRRLLDDSDASITLAGITLHGMIDKPLALARAEAVAQYLKSAWNISDDRIRIITHPLAKEIAVALDSDGIVEANRVEIASNSFAVLQPVMGSDTLRTVTPPSVRFHPAAAYSESLSSWTVQASQQGKLLKSFAGQKDLPKTIDWILADDQNSVPHYPGTIDYRLTVRGSHRDSGVASGSLPVEQISLRKKKVQRIADREIEKYNLLLFDLQSSELNENNKQIIELIQKHLKDISTITIVGHTDRTGETELNKRLSLERAKTTARALGVAKAEIRGIAD